MRNILIKYVWAGLIVSCLFPFSGQTQTLLYTEDFANGLPASWQSGDLFGTSARWEYCANQPDQFPNCPEIWNVPPINQSAFASSTALNGFAHFDSDLFSNTNPFVVHNTYLETDSYDFSGQSKVWIKFECQVGIFVNPTIDRAVLEVSTNGLDWGTYNFIDLLPGISPDPGIIAWSKNPSIAVIDISDLAAGQSNVKIRWRWLSINEYYFAIDDVQFYDDDPRPFFFEEQDLEMANFYAIFPNYITPRTQVESFRFLGDFFNRGYAPINDVKFRGVISNTNGVLFRDTVVVDSVGPFSLNENILFNKNSPLFSEPGFYFGNYILEGVADDPTPFNNSNSFQFRISDTIFAKAPNIDDHLQPDQTTWGNNPRNWAWGNYYFLPNGEGEKASGVSFAIAPAVGMEMSELAGLELDILLYKWVDENGDGLVQASERAAINASTYTVQGNEDPFSYNYAEFPFEVELEDNTAYLAMISFTATQEVPDIRIGAYRFLDYGGMILQTALLKQPRYASVLWIDVPGNDVFSTQGFGFSLTANVRLHLRKNTVNVATIPDQSPIKVYPNPSSGEIYINTAGNSSGLTKLQVVDIMGKPVHRQALNHCHQCKISLQELPSGSYFLHLTNANKETINKVLVLAKGQ